MPNLWRLRAHAVLPASFAVLLLLSACSNGDAGGAPPGCDPATSTTTTLLSGDVRLLPFAEDGPWRTPVATPDEAQAAETTAGTTTLRTGTDAGPPGDDHGWVNAEDYSLPLARADVCDPVVTFESPNGVDELSGTDIHIPVDAIPAAGTDRHLMVFQPDGRSVVEMWGAERISDNRWSAGRIELVDLTGSGIGPDNGVRAYGGSAIGGLIRTWEVDPSDPNYTDGVIRHPLAIALPSSMLLYTGGTAGYDDAGNGTALGYVWPATEQDYDSEYTYGGNIPMGSRVMLPPDVDIAGLGLPSALVPVAQALQDYGAFITDRAGPGTVALYAEPTAPSAWLDEARGPSFTGGYLDLIRAHLVVVP